MGADLRDWQTRLTRHFAELRNHRGSDVTARPIFGLEHGLEPPEIEALAAAVRAHIAEHPPSQDHTLAWIVYSAELGYGYSGDEYWQTFEQETPGWLVNGDRYWLRRCYRQFQREFGGAVPSGPWAEHFSIICWPITHAILPRDLQRQLARILYELRHLFSAELFESPATLGEFVAARSWNATSRFRNLAQETLLVGQIAAALLLRDEVGTSSLVYPATLDRISKDLDRERRAREWLRGARRFAQERARIRGLAPVSTPAASPVRRTEEVRAEVAALGIEPRVVLRPADVAGTSWDVSLEIPDLSHLLFRFPSTREILTGSRCVVAGAAGRPLARGRFLHGAQRVALARWPHPDEVLLQFEQTDPQLEYLLRTECLLRPGPPWLFRIASDRLAYESRSLRVRPGERYIIVTANGPVAPSEHVSPIDLRCEGIHGALLNLPSALTTDWEEALRRLGLRQARTIEVWPVGLVPVVWDGEGHGEWLAAEQPCLAIRSDHPISALLVSMSGGAERPLELASIPAGEPVFVQLPPLPIGLHTVRVCARTGPDTEGESAGDLDVVMRIREARPWTPGVTPYGPLVVQVDPTTPTLEQLWEGQADIEVRGPAGRNVTCTVSLFDREDDAPTAVGELPALPFPITPARWRAHFESHFRETPRAQDSYDTARLCRLEFAAEELGAFTVQCEREFVPLRWAVRRHKRPPAVRLIDDSGNAIPPEVSHFSFDKPAVRKRLEPAPEYDVSAPGGLYVARQENFRAAVIALPKISTLDDLKWSVHIDARGRSADEVIDAVQLGAAWGSAKSSGDILSLRNRRKVLHAITRHILLLVGGGRWAAAEAEVENGGDLGILKRAVSRRADEVGIAAALALETAQLSAARLEARITRVADLAMSFHLLPKDAPGGPEPETSGWIAEFALRLASSPRDAGVWAGPNLRSGVTRLLDVPTLARAARFLVIATDRHLQSHAAPGELYASWCWT